MEKAVQLVNNPQLLEMKSEQQTKNLKKIATGLKAAEVRRAKQSERLTQLEELKKGMLDEPSERQLLQSKQLAAVTSGPAARQSFDWMPWILGGLVLAAVAWQSTKKKQMPRPRPVTVGTTSATPAFAHLNSEVLST